jgi:hypothetical protein
LAAAKAIDKSFDPATSIRALQFFGDGTLNRVPVSMQADLIVWAKAVNLLKLPIFQDLFSFCRVHKKESNPSVFVLFPAIRLIATDLTCCFSVPER